MYIYIYTHFDIHNFPKLFENIIYPKNLIKYNIQNF